MTHFPPSPCILAPVLMARPAYAQLQGQVFHPPRVFGPEWSVRDSPDLADEARWRDLGVKIATGFEIMYREGGRRARAGEAATKEDLGNDAEYQRYLTSLKKAGWFGAEIEGSDKWNSREDAAMKGWNDITVKEYATSPPVLYPY